MANGQLNCEKGKKKIQLAREQKKTPWMPVCSQPRHERVRSIHACNPQHKGYDIASACLAGPKKSGPLRRDSRTAYA